MSFTSEITARNDQQLSMDDLIALVYAHASRSWQEQAALVVVHLCQNRRTFTADDVLEKLEGIPCHDLRALGAVMRDAAASGYCRTTGQYVKSRLPQRHKRPVAVWESLPLRA